RVAVGHRVGGVQRGVDVAVAVGRIGKSTAAGRRVVADRLVAVLGELEVGVHLIGEGFTGFGGQIEGRFPARGDGILVVLGLVGVLGLIGVLGVFGGLGVLRGDRAFPAPVVADQGDDHRDNEYSDDRAATDDDPQVRLASASTPRGRGLRGVTGATTVGWLTSSVHGLTRAGGPVAGLSAGAVVGRIRCPGGSAVGIATLGLPVRRLALAVLPAAIGVLRRLVVRSLFAHGSPRPVRC